MEENKKKAIIYLMIYFLACAVIGGYIGYSLANYGSSQEERDDGETCIPSDAPYKSFEYGGIKVNYEKSIKKEEIIGLLSNIDSRLMNGDYFNNITFSSNFCICDNKGICEEKTGQFDGNSITVWYFSGSPSKTLNHEIGHALWKYKLSFLQKYRWCQLYKKYNGTEQIRDYGKTDCVENFADNVRYYYFLPEILVEEKKEVLEGWLNEDV